MRGIGTWIVLEIVAGGHWFAPQFAGLLAAIAGMTLGSLAPQVYGLQAHEHTQSHTRHAQST